LLEHPPLDTKKPVSATQVRGPERAIKRTEARGLGPH
jgi:hypothetical protein